MFDNKLILAMFDEDPTEQTLYSYILKGNIAMMELANGWIQRYQEDRDTALLEMIQGCYIFMSFLF